MNNNETMSLRHEAVKWNNDGITFCGLKFTNMYALRDYINRVVWILKQRNDEYIFNFDDDGNEADISESFYQALNKYSYKIPQFNLKWEKTAYAE